MSKCPYDKNVICHYAGEGFRNRVYECADCPHYVDTVPKPEEEQIAVPKKRVRLFDLLISIGIIIAFVILLVLFLFGMSIVISWLQP